MATSGEDVIRTRSGRRFRTINATGDDRMRAIPKPPDPQKRRNPLVRENHNSSSRMRMKLGNDSVSSLTGPSAVNILGDSRVPVLISRSKRHNLRRTQPLPAIGKPRSQTDMSVQVRKTAINCRESQTYCDRFPLSNEPTLSDSCVTIAVRLLDGRRVERRFSEGDRLGCVFSYAEQVSGGSLPGSCELLVGGMAEKTLGDRELEETLRKLGIRSRTLLYLQEADTDG